MASRRNPPRLDEPTPTPPTLPGSLAPDEPTETTTPEMGVGGTFTRKMGQFRQAREQLVAAGTGSGDQYAPTVPVREVLGVGGYIQFDTKTNTPLRYVPGETGYVPTGRNDKGVGLYVKGMGREELDKLSPEALVTVQSQLRKGGYLSNYSPGYVTAKDVSALERLMADANVANLSWQEMMAVRATNNGGAGGYGRTVVRVSNPLDIEAAANQVAQQLIGRSLDDETMRRFVAAFQGAQRASAYGSTQAPDIQTFTADRLAQMFPTETYARQFGGYMEALQQRYGF